MKLNQTLAIEKGIKTRAYDGISQLHKIAQKDSSYYGFSKTYVAKEEGGETYPPESQKVLLRAEDVLKSVQKSLVELFDVTATKDYANLSATANVKIGDTTILSEVPVTYLLFLEKQLTDIKTFVSKMPSLDETNDWTKEESSGLYKTKELSRHRSAKVQKPIVLYDATDKHPAQTQLIAEDVVVGYWKEVKSSGAITRDRKEQLLDRVETLLNAVKSARETANSVDAEVREIGNSLFNYLFA